MKIGSCLRILHKHCDRITEKKISLDGLLENINKYKITNTIDMQFILFYFLFYSFFLNICLEEILVGTHEMKTPYEERCPEIESL